MAIYTDYYVYHILCYNVVNTGILLVPMGVPTQYHSIISMRKYLNFHFETNVCGNDRSSEPVSFGHDYILFGRPERDPCIIRPNGILCADTRHRILCI